MITTAGKVRDVMGTDENLALEDEQIETLIKMAEKEVLRDLFTLHWMETPDANEYTGALWDGSNTRYTIGGNIADSDFDQSTNDDVTGYWLDSTFTVQTCSITVNNAIYGYVDIYQSDGLTAIPATAEEVKVIYYNSDEVVPFADLEEMGTLLAAHNAQDRLTEPRKISMADLESNKKWITVNPFRFYERYKSLVRKYSEPMLKGT